MPDHPTPNLEPEPIPELVAGVLERSDGLPTLPRVVAEIHRVLDDPSVDMRKVAAVIEKDPALTVRVLKVANSAYSGFTGKVSTIQLACSLLGQATLEGLVTSMGVIQTLKTGTDAYFDPERFWEHSVCTGLCAQDLSFRLGYNLRGDVFTCGILHDIGKIVMSHFLHEHFVKMVELHRTGVPYREAEKRIYGADHTKIGYWTAVRWGLPETFSMCILEHHGWPEKRETPLQKRVAAVYLGNVVAHMGEYKREKGRYPTLRPEFQEKFGIGQEIAMQVAETAYEKAQKFLPAIVDPGKKPAP